MIIIVIISESYVAHISTNKVIKALEQKETLFERPTYVAPYKGLQGTAARRAAIARNTSANPFS